MYRLAILLTLLIALLAGCGGGSEDGADGSSPAVAQAPEKDSGGGSKDDADAGDKRDRAAAKDRSEDREKKDDSAAGGAPDSGDKDSVSSTQDEYTEALEKAPKKGVAKLIRIAVDGTLALHSLKLAKLELRDRGHDITVVVTRASACNALASDEPAMRQRIRQGAPVVKQAAFEVAGTGKAFGYYVLGCKRPKIPNGPGKVVWQRTAVGGPVTSERFKITGKKWALEYENQGASLAVVVVGVGGGAKGEYYEPIGSQKPEAGRKVYKGPGVFVMKIQGAGRWTLRAKDLG